MRSLICYLRSLTCYVCYLKYELVIGIVLPFNLVDLTNVKALSERHGLFDLVCCFPSFLGTTSKNY